MIKYEVSNSAFKSTCSFEKLSEYLIQEVESCTDLTVSTKNPNVMDLCVLWETFCRGKLALESGDACFKSVVLFTLLLYNLTYGEIWAYLYSFAVTCWPTRLTRDILTKNGFFLKSSSVQSWYLSHHAESWACSSRRSVLLAKMLVVHIYFNK